MEYSILIPVYKAEQYLAAAIDSALAQSFTDFEILLAEDGSPDGCGRIMDDYAARYPDKVRALHFPHRGTIFTRREAIRQARGRFIVWLDSDDLLETEALSTIHQARQAAADTDMVIYEYNFFADTSGREIRRPALFPDMSLFTGPEEKKAVYEYLIRGSLLDSLCLKAIRRELLQEDPSDFSENASNPFGEDVLHCLYPVTKARSIRYLTASLYRYRMHEGSVMHVFTPANLDKRFNELKFRFFRPFMEEWGLCDEAHLTLQRAASYKGVLDGILYFLENGTEKKALSAYTADFVRRHPELKELSSSPSLSLKQRVTLTLFRLNRLGAIEAIYAAVRRLRK